MSLAVTLEVEGTGLQLVTRPWCQDSESQIAGLPPFTVISPDTSCVHDTQESICSDEEELHRGTVSSYSRDLIEPRKMLVRENARC